MKISEGIRIGSRGKRAITDAWWDGADGVCAVGALMRLPYVTGPQFKGDLYAAFPSLKSKMEDNFDIQYYPPGYLVNNIINRNKAGWSFQQIIEWLESIGQ